MCAHQPPMWCKEIHRYTPYMNMWLCVKLFLPPEMRGTTNNFFGIHFYQWRGSFFTYTCTGAPNCAQSRNRGLGILDKSPTASKIIGFVTSTCILVECLVCKQRSTGTALLLVAAATTGERMCQNGVCEKK